MTTSVQNDARRGIATYLAAAFGLSAVLWALIIHAKSIGAAGGLYVTALMWCPALGALITCRALGRPVASLGWKWIPRYQWLGYLIPLGYALAAYLAVWLTGLGGFPNRDFLDRIATVAGWKGFPPGVVLVLYVALQGTVGMVSSTASALGEEIGWRGFLVPELAKVSSFTTTAFVSGIIWASWHVPLILFADYHGKTPAWFSLTCFAVMVIGIGFLFAWIRLRSGSIWACAFLHASHNLFIQSILTPLTTDTGRTAWAIDEFGGALALAAIAVAVIVWRKRGLLEAARLPA
jgi:membrane protease YdiL (CAAX protease family)